MGGPSSFFEVRRKNSAKSRSDCACSSRVASPVRIKLIRIKNFCLKNKFLNQFTPRQPSRARLALDSVEPYGCRSLGCDHRDAHRRHHALLLLHQRSGDVHFERATPATVLGLCHSLLAISRNERQVLQQQLGPAFDVDGA